ncbi:hypothetical protein AAC387_Pa01g0914 [Persea americana]
MGSKFTISPTQIQLLVILLTFSSSIGIGSCVTNSTPGEQAMIKFRPVELTQYPGNDIGNVGRRRLAPFQLCLLCKCCAANDPSNCANMPCCFGIDCQLPDKPFGTCAFVPKTCNCTSCAM